MARNASPTAIEPEAQLIALVLFGPIAPSSIAMLQLAEPPNTPSARPGSTARSPCDRNTASCSSAMRIPPSALPIITTEPLAVLARHVDPRVLDRLLGARDREGAEAVQPLHLLRLDIVLRVEVVHLGRVVAAVHRGIEARQPADRRALCPDSAPHPFTSRADRRHPRRSPSPPLAAVQPPLPP
jgi:hypothetical protein